MLKLIMVCVTIIIVVSILSKKEKVEDIHKDKIMYDKNAIINKQTKEKIEKMNKEMKDRTCPKCNKYNHNNYDGRETEKQGIVEIYFACFECKECGATWKIKTGVGQR